MANSKYTYDQVIALAGLAASDYAASCTGTTIRGRNGEKEFRGMTVAQKATALKISEEEAKSLGLKDETMVEVALRLGLSWSEAQGKLIDLATASFDEMSEHWKKVNIESAKGMIALMEEMGGEDVILAIDLQAEEQRKRYGTLLHELWLSQPENDWALGTSLELPFSKLDPVQQEKDIQQLRSLQKWLRELRGVQ